MPKQSNTDSGRLGVRLSPEFLAMVQNVAQLRGMNLTEFTKQSLMLNVLRTPTKFDEVPK